MTVRAHDASPFTRAGAVMDFPTYREHDIPVTRSEYRLEGKTPYTAIALAVYLPDTPSAFLAGAVLSARAGETPLAVLDGARTIFGGRRCVGPIEIKVTVAPKILALGGARIRILAVVASRAVTTADDLRVLIGEARTNAHRPVH